MQEDAQQPPVENTPENAEPVKVEIEEIPTDIELKKTQDTHTVELPSPDPLPPPTPQPQKKEIPQPMPITSKKTELIPPPTLVPAASVIEQQKPIEKKAVPIEFPTTTPTPEVILKENTTDIPLVVDTPKKETPRQTTLQQEILEEDISISHVSGDYRTQDVPILTKKDFDTFVQKPDLKKEPPVVDTSAAAIPSQSFEESPKRSSGKKIERNNQLHSTHTASEVPQHEITPIQYDQVLDLEEPLKKHSAEIVQSDTIHVEQVDNIIIFSSQTINPEQERLDSEPMDFTPITSFSELTDAVELIENLPLPELPEDQSEFQEQPHIVIEVSDDIIHTIKELATQNSEQNLGILEEDRILDDVELETIDHNPLQYIEQRTVTEDNTEKIVLSAISHQAEPDLAATEMKNIVVPIITIPELGAVFDYAQILISESESTENEDDILVENVHPQSTSDIEIIASDAMVKFIEEVRESIPPQPPEEQKQTVEDNETMITFTTEEKDGEKVSMSSNEFTAIKEFLEDQHIFSETLDSLPSEENAIDLKEEYHNSGVEFQIITSPEPMVIFDLATDTSDIFVDEKDPVLYNLKEEEHSSENQYILLRSGTEEIQIELALLKKLLKLDAVRLLLDEVELIGEQSPEEIISEYAMPHAGNTLPSFLYYPLILCVLSLTTPTSTVLYSVDSSTRSNELNRVNGYHFSL